MPAYDTPSERFKTFIKPAYTRALNLLPAKWHVGLDYFRAHRRFPDLKNPKRFSEKIAWRILYDRDPSLPGLVDKIRVKEIMAERFGEDFIIPTLRVYNSAEEMDFSKPPLSEPPYIIKGNHGSGMNLIIRKGDPVDPQAIKKLMAKWLKYDHAAVAREWAYESVTPKIFVESYIEVPQGDLTDYKFHTFAGTVYAIDVITDRFKNYGVSFYTRDWKPMNIGYGGVAGRRYPRQKELLEPPPLLAEMIERAELISRDYPYIRVDLYQVNDKVKLGELTFYPSAGHDPFDPPEWDYKFGDQWKMKP